MHMSESINHEELKNKLLKKPATQTQTLKSLIQLGTNGHLPLFHEEWIREAIETKKSKPMNFMEAKRKVHKGLTKLNHHRQLDRKKMAINQMPKKERVELVKAFLKMIENEVLDNSKELH